MKRFLAVISLTTIASCKTTIVSVPCIPFNAPEPNYTFHDETKEPDILDIISNFIEYDALDRAKSLHIYRCSNETS